MTGLVSSLLAFLRRAWPWGADAPEAAPAPASLPPSRDADITGRIDTLLVDAQTRSRRVHRSTSRVELELLRNKDAQTRARIASDFTGECARCVRGKDGT